MFTQFQQYINTREHPEYDVITKEAAFDLLHQYVSSMPDRGTKELGMNMAKYFLEYRRGFIELDNGKICVAKTNTNVFLCPKTRREQRHVSHEEVLHTKHKGRKVMQSVLTHLLPGDTYVHETVVYRVHRHRIHGDLILLLDGQMILGTSVCMCRRHTQRIAIRETPLSELGIFIERLARFTRRVEKQVQKEFVMISLGSI